MFAVIFTAELAKLDHEYAAAADLLRERAKTKYGCIGFASCKEGFKEVSISYWKCMADIKAWKADAEHLRAQALGQQRWYKNYNVQIVEVLGSYAMNGKSLSPSC